MKWSAFIGSLLVLTMSAGVASLGCQRKAEKPGASGAGLPPIAQTSAAPASLMLSDFRLNPPIVEEMSVRRGSGGRMLLEAKFAPDARFQDRITLMPDTSPIVLHDDGRDGDRAASDRVFTAAVPGRFDEFAAGQRRLLESLSKREDARRVFLFRGREVVDSLFLDDNLLSKMLGQDLIQLLPVGSGTVDEHRSLVVTDLSVVEDPTRTFDPCSDTGTAGGKWTFGYLMREAANTPLTGIDPSDFVQRWLQRWLANQSVNSFNVPARAAAMQQILNRWPKLADGRLDIDRAPVKLLAIVNRIDLGTNPAYGGGGNAGEGRFVFGVMNTAVPCSPMPFTIIFEYGIPKHSCEEIRDWAQAWLNLGTLAFGTPAYNDALEAITEQFAKANSDPSKPNGSALNQLRTDENALNPQWELREFRIFSTDSDAGQLREVTVKQTPDRASFAQGGVNNSKLANWVTANSGAVLLDAHTVPADLPFPDLIPFLGGSSPNSINFWNATGLPDDQRFHFSLNTCDACHGRETDTPFLHISTPNFGTEAEMSGFMKGNGSGGPIVVTDPVNAAITHSFFDLEHRAQVLFDFANKPCFFLLGFRPIHMPH